MIVRKIVKNSRRPILVHHIKMRMKYIIGIITLTMLLSANASAKMKPDEPGTVRTYSSDNGRYEVSITGSGNILQSWSLKEDGKELWSTAASIEPGVAAISDNGETITTPMWGWQDEGGSKGVAVYNKKGELVRKVLFRVGPGGEETLRWVHETRISPDGKYFAISEDSKEGARITLFNASTGDVVWEKGGGYPSAAEVKVSAGGKYALSATNEDKGAEMIFLLFDHKGAIIWQKKIDKNQSYGVKHYLKFKDDGSGFEIYDLRAGKYISEEMPKKNTQRE